MEIFSTKLASQQHHHEDGNLQHEAGISTTSARSWHLNNINTKLEIFSMRLASQQHQHEAGNLQHKVGINTTPPFEGGPFGLYQACLESAQTLHETKACQHICNLFIHTNIMELYGSSLHHVTNVMISDFYVF
jgi:hypothetical protein